MNAALAGNRGMITFGLILASFMTAMDTTVVNIAMPHIQGSLSASPEQITWVITSYFIATAVTIPVSGWMVAHFGLKRMLMGCVLGFTAASMLCGLATTLPELVMFRVLQGILAAPILPIAQAVIMNINPPERIGQAAAIITMAAVFAPAIGPIAGGWLTESLTWRWCFYINVPAGLLSAFLLQAYLPDTPPERRRFDFLGFGSLAVAIGSLQLMLDRGTMLDWFSSAEICIEAAVSATAFWIFIVHSLTTSAPLFPLALLRDRNYVASSVFGFIFSILTFSSFAMLPLMMQGILGYSVMHSGVLSVPRGIIMLILLQIMSRVDVMVDRRLLVALGLGCFVFAFWRMSFFDLSMDGSAIIWATAWQGIGQGILFVPLATLGFATVPHHLRADASAANALMRNLGGSIGVASMQALAAQNTQTMHASLAAHITPLTQSAWGLAETFSPETVQGAAALDAEITRQAMMVAYVSDFRLLTWFGLACIPLVLMMRPPRAARS